MTLTCPCCGGRGFKVFAWDLCKVCKGNGFIVPTALYQFDDDGSVVKDLSGNGNHLHRRKPSDYIKMLRGEESGKSR